jgi:hypothetical protein
MSAIASIATGNATRFPGPASQSLRPPVRLQPLRHPPTAVFTSDRGGVCTGGRPFYAMLQVRISRTFSPLSGGGSDRLRGRVGFRRLGVGWRWLPRGAVGQHPSLVALIRHLPSGDATEFITGYTVQPKARRRRIELIRQSRRQGCLHPAIKSASTDSSLQPTSAGFVRLTLFISQLDYRLP